MTTVPQQPHQPESKQLISVGGGVEIFSAALVTCLIAMTNHLTDTAYRRKGFILTHSLKGSSSWWGKHCVGMYRYGHVTSALKKADKGDVVPLAF